MKYVISSYFDSQDRLSNIKLLVLKLLKVPNNGWGNMIDAEEQTFIYRLDSKLAQHIIAQPKETHIDVDMDSFVEGDLEVDGIDLNVYYHRDYLHAQREFEQRYLDYNALKAEALNSKSKIPYTFLQHIYSHFHEKATDKEIKRYYSLIIKRSKVESSLINSTLEIVRDIKRMLWQNCNVELLKKIMEEGFRIKNFRNVKFLEFENEETLTLYETSQTSFDPNEKQILLFGILNHSPTFNSAILNMTLPLWNLILFIIASETTDFKYYIEEKYIEIRIDDLIIEFRVLDLNTYQIKIC